jgi:uncharacterized protein (TIGR02266 family)
VGSICPAAQEANVVTDISSTARTARESLSRGLNALQSDPSVPPQVLELAGTIAQAMGALHQIERSNGAQLVPHAELALNNVRSALSQLQSQPAGHPALEQAMEAVASSLGLVHALNKLAAAPAAAPAHVPAPAPAFPQPAQPAWQPQAAPAPAPAPSHAPPAQPAWQPQAAPAPAPAQPAWQPQAAPAPAPAQPAWQPQAAPPAPAPAQPAWQPQPAGAQADPFARPAAPVPLDSLHPPAPPMAGGAAIVEAALGTNSATNFYKGLAGNDIVEHGGLFIATYKILKVGTPLRLKVSLPGGYEFEANAVVRWTSEPAGGGEPGFGAQFTQVTQEARQLIYRYARNREPLFHDDL